MAPGVIIRLKGADGVERQLGQLDKVLVRPTLERVGTLVVRSVRRGIREQVSPDGTPYRGVRRYGRPGKRLQDTGRLLRSITYQVSGSRLVVGTNLHYAPRQHFGGTVVPKKAKMLAIPLTRAVARAVAGRGFRTAFPDAFAFTSRNGNVLLARKRPASGKLELLALLRHRTHVDGTRFMGLSKRGRTEVVMYVESVARKKVEGRS